MSIAFSEPACQLNKMVQGFLVFWKILEDSLQHFHLNFPCATHMHTYSGSKAIKKKKSGLNKNK